jgi:tetratricopeptide (TPR) repeat protein
MKFKIGKAFLLAFFVGLSTKICVFAQVEGISIISAENYYLDKDYRNALIGFEEYLLNIQFDKKVSFKAGICATRLGIGKRAVQHIKAAKKSGEIDNYLPFWLGRAFHLDEQWDSASKYFNEYLDVFPIDKSYKRDTERYLRQIVRAKEMAPTSLQPIIIENMGNGINSVYSEFHPILTKDGKTMVFSGRKKGFPEEKILDDGEYKEKIFSSHKLADGTWSKGIPIRLIEGRNKDLDFNLVQQIENSSNILLVSSSILTFSILNSDSLGIDSIFLSLSSSCNLREIPLSGPV